MWIDKSCCGFGASYTVQQLSNRQAYSSFTTVHSPEPLFSSDGAVDRLGSMREGGAMGTMVGIPGM